LLDPMKQRVDALAEAAGYEGRIVLLVDETIPDGDVRVEWADGGAERDSARLWRDVDAALKRLTDAPPPDAAARPSAEAGAGDRPAASAGAGKQPAAADGGNADARPSDGQPDEAETPAAEPGLARRSA
jgi:flagellar assembly protein FliH